MSFETLGLAPELNRALAELGYANATPIQAEAIPLVMAGGKPGNEIQSPMGQVILGGLLTSTFLNMVVVPVLFRRWGALRAAERLVDPERTVSVPREAPATG